MRVTKFFLVQHLVELDMTHRSSFEDVDAHNYFANLLRLAHRQWILRDLMLRYDHQKIYEVIWLQPILHVAKRYGMSDVGLGKICKKLKSPRPGLGYWAKKAAGKRVPNQPELPELLS